MWKDEALRTYLRWESYIIIVQCFRILGKPLPEGISYSKAAIQEYLGRAIDMLISGDCFFNEIG